MDKTNFLDQISESESQIIAEGTLKKNLSVPRIFHQSDFQISSLSTASSLVSQLEVPDIFGRSSFVEKIPIFGSQLFASFKNKNNNISDTSLLYGLLCNSNEDEIEDNVEIFLEEHLPNFGSQKKCPFVCYETLSVATNEPNEEWKKQRNPECASQLFFSYSLEAKHIALLTRLKTFLELKMPIHCAMMHFSSLERSSEIIDDRNIQELLSYILIFYWIVKTNEASFKRIVQAKEIKNLFDLYLLFVKEFKIPAF